MAKAAPRSTDTIRILHVDDEPDIAATAADFLEQMNKQFEVEIASSADEGLQRLNEMEFECVISDYDMPEISGLEFLTELREEYPDLPFVLYTGKGSEQIASEAISAGVTDYLQKRAGTEQYELLANRVENAVNQYRSQKQADQTRRYLKELTESTTDCIWMFDRDWEELLYISGYEEVWNRSTAVIRENPQDFLEGVHPDHRGFVEDAMDRLSNGESIDIEYKISRGDSETAWVWVKGDPIFDDGDVVRVVGFTRDITDRKLRQQELETINNQYQTLVENFPDGAVFLFDRDLTYVRVGGQELSAVGLSPSDIVGETPHDLFPEKVADETVHHYRATLDGASQTYEQEYQGERYRVQTTPVRTGDREIPYGLAVSQNITEETVREQALKRQKNRLEEFTSVISHDLRDPLQVASGNLELARNNHDSEHLAAVADAHARLDELIENLLTLARTGEKIYEMEEIALNEIANQCWQTVVTDTATLQVTTEQTIAADRSRFRQLLENLYRNAVEHGDADVTVGLVS